MGVGWGGVGWSQYLSVEGDGAGLALGADPLGPRWMALAARLDLTADVLQGRKLPSVEDDDRETGGWRQKVRVSDSRDLFRSVARENQSCSAAYLSAPPVSLRM